MNTKRTPPHNLDAEESLLGAMLLSRTAIAAAEAASVASSDFYMPRHGHLFDAIVSVYGQREPVDIVTVADELRRTDLLDSVGGDAWLRVVQASTPASASAGAYARIVHDLATRRRLIGLAGDLAEMGYADDEEVPELLDFAATRIASFGADLADPTWRPVDLDPILRGEYEPAVPAVGLCRSDGLALLYPGKEHTVIGEMESGKSWFCAASAVDELLHDHVVVYVHYEEADPTDTIERLIALRVPTGLIAKNFLFVGPDTPIRHGSMDRLLAAAPTLVINDGVNEAMSLHGWGIRDEDGAAAYRRHLVKPFTAVGATVLSADHVVKDREKRGRDALGSIHKGNGLTGSLVLIENAEPFGRGLRGRSHVFITKDRPGYLRRRGRASRLPGKTFIGELVVDDTRETDDVLTVTLWAPNPDNDDNPDTDHDERGDDERLVLQAVADLTAKAKVANGRAVRGALSISHGRVDDAIERLLASDELVESPGPRGARIFTLGTTS